MVLAYEEVVETEKTSSGGKKGKKKKHHHHHHKKEGDGEHEIMSPFNEGGGPRKRKSVKNETKEDAEDFHTTLL